MKKWIVRCLCLALVALCVFGAVKLFSQRETAHSEPPAASSEPESTAPSELDAVYSLPVTEGYADIRTLGEDYSKEQAQADRCFVIGAMVHNDDLYSAFMEHCQKKEDAFLRVVQNTVEGDAVVYDLLYDSGTDTVLLINDSTRDRFSEGSERDITLRRYEHIAEYSDGAHLYWIVYNGPQDEIDLTGENTFVLTLIN